MDPKIRNLLLGAFVIGIFVVIGFALYMNRGQDVETPAPELVTFCQDRDADGHGNPGICVQRSQDKAPSGHVANSDDCNDTNPDVYPDALEICDGFDNDCNGLVDAVEIYLYPGDTVSVFIDCQSAQELVNFPEQQCFFLTGWFRGEEEQRTMRYCRPQGRDPQ